MSLIQRVGGHGLAELIISQILTNASCPNCYFPDKKVYGFVAAEEDQIYFFDEDSNQYLNCLDASESLGEHVLLVDLKAELFGVGCERKIQRSKTNRKNCTCFKKCDSKQRAI